MFCCFVTAIVLLGVTTALTATGRRNLCVEVDMGTTLGAVTSLGCACSGLGIMLEQMSVLTRAAAWTTFAVICVLSSMLSVLAMNSTAL